MVVVVVVVVVVVLVVVTATVVVVVTTGSVNFSGENVSDHRGSSVAHPINVNTHKLSSEIRIEDSYPSDFRSDCSPTIPMYSEQHEWFVVGHSSKFWYPIGQKPSFCEFDFDNEWFAMNVVAFFRRLSSVSVTKPRFLQ